MLITTVTLKKQQHTHTLTHIDMIPSISPPLVMEERWKSKVLMRAEEARRGKREKEMLLEESK